MSDVIELFEVRGHENVDEEFGICPSSGIGGRAGVTAVVRWMNLCYSKLSLVLAKFDLSFVGTLSKKTVQWFSILE